MGTECTDMTLNKLHNEEEDKKRLALILKISSYHTEFLSKCPLWVLEDMDAEGRFMPEDQQLLYMLRGKDG